MSRTTLKFLAVVLGILIVIVFFAGLDGLPRSLRKQIDNERIALASAQSRLRSEQDQVLRNLQTEAELFRAVPASQQWPEQLSKALGDLQLAAHNLEQLNALEKQNRRQDRAQAEKLLAQEQSLRSSATAQADTIHKDAAHWVELKQHLPEELQKMERNYQAVQSYDLAAVAAAVQKAETDWPDKRGDLDARLNRLRAAATQASVVWQASAEERKEAAAADFAHLDLTALVSADNQLATAATSIPKDAADLQALSSQLYGAWDKLLVDMEVRSGEPQQKIRTVTTHFADATAKAGEVGSNEKWVPVSKATYEAEKNDLGMAIEHKAAGKYDIEAERVAQPAGFAYVAPPSQGSNQYGYWDHSGGRDFWVFYGQYALLRDLLFNNQYRPIDRGDWEGYRTYQSRRQTYYGRDTEVGDNAPKYGTQGTSTQERYSGSSYAKGGGFRDSKFATKSGSYNDSKYASPGGDRSPKRFGNGSRPEDRHVAPPPSRPMPRSSPRPSFRPPSSGRRFGRR